MIQAVFAAFFLGVLLVQSDFSKENKLLFAVGTAFLLLAFAAFFSWGIWRQTGLASWIWKKQSQ
ncbi:MAG: hypothetical protein ACLSCO_15640 [Gallintestinimicrobium sp.]